MIDSAAGEIDHDEERAPFGALSVWGRGYELLSPKHIFESIDCSTSSP